LFAACAPDFFKGIVATGSSLDDKPQPSLGGHCASCEFRGTQAFDECWVDVPEVGGGNLVLDALGIPSKTKTKLIQQGVYRTADVDPEDTSAEEYTRGDLEAHKVRKRPSPSLYNLGMFHTCI
jgi:hypothetical protein